jgi:hypothetical protein
MISPLTAKTHVRNVLRKLDCHDRVTLVTLAYETPLIKPARWNGSTRSRPRSADCDASSAARRVIQIIAQAG